MNLASKQP